MGKYEVKVTESTDTGINLQDFLILEALIQSLKPPKSNMTVLAAPNA